MGEVAVHPEPFWILATPSTVIVGPTVETARRGGLAATGSAITSSVQGSHPCCTTAGGDGVAVGERLSGRPHWRKRRLPANGPFLPLKPPNARG